jgi:hypothetical protein
MALRSPLASVGIAVLGIFAGGALGACSSDAAGGGAAGSAQGGALATSGAAGTPAQLGGSGGVVAAAGAPASGGSSAGADSTQGGGGSAGTASGGSDAGSGSAGAPGSGGRGGGGGGGASAGSGSAGSPSGGASGGPPSNCGLPTPVSFQKNIQGFLTTSCGKTASPSGGCHVTDINKTSLGYDHAYDWITAIAHTASCGKTQPYVKRFEVVLAVIAGAKPATCPNSRQMPPPGTGTSLTTCQVAALQAWLAEPMVSQTHVPETDDTQNMYPPGPYLMPPFN